MKKISILLSFLFITSISFGQSEAETKKATFSAKAVSVKKVPSIASRIEDGTFIPAENLTKEYNPRRSDGNKVVPGKGLPIGKDPLLDFSKSSFKNPTKEPIITWDAATSNTTPTDPTGAVGPDHFVNAWNSSFRIWSKDGTSLTDAASLSNIWPGETDGDPIVMYDKFADRFIITQFTGAGWGSTTPGFLIAISEGSDPVNDEWYTYEFTIDAFPDYPKYSIWSDGYYITANKNSSSASTSDVVYVLERDKIILGDTSAQMVAFSLPEITTSGFYSPLGFNCNGPELPASGNAPIVYMQDDAWDGVTEDHLKIWTIDVDWDSTELSTISDPQEISTQVFDGVFNGGSFSNLEQPSGSDIDALQATIMYMAQFRKFENHNSAVFNFVVDLDNDDSRAGVRWFELRQDNDSAAWSIFQEGTYEQEDGHSAFSASMAMDSLGNIGLAFSVVSSTKSVSVHYTGRFANDPLNQMTLAEGVIVEGSNNNPSTRYGDYAQMTLDPSDDLTFWHIAEYFGSSRKNIVGAFRIVPDFNIDAGIVEVNAPVNGTLGSDESVTVSIRNFGSDTLFNVPVSYVVDNGSVVSETYSDTILPTSTVLHTFATSTDLSILGSTYEIKAYTAYLGDEDMNNDTLISMVTHLQANDIGVTEILEPITAEGLTNSETVKVNIENFGANSQSNFEVNYQVNGASPVSETVAGPIELGETLEYSFSTTVDLSAFGEHEIKAYSSLTGDINNDNDTSAVIIENSLCQPEANCNSGDGLTLVNITTLDNPSDCSSNGYGDFTNMTAELNQGTMHNIILATGYGNQYVNVWIDFNDNFLFEANELVVDNFILGEGEGSGDFMDTTEFNIAADAALGEHMMRAKANWNNLVPENACQGTNYGETEDYTANISSFVGINTVFNEPNDLIIKQLPNNQFEVSFNALNTNETLIISVHNTLGQQLIHNRVNGVNGSYFYDFDMSYASPGVYLIRLGSDKFGKVKKIVVD